MDIRVECPCGQAYAFGVEPVNNAMPCPVACPVCGADGTELANQYIRASLGAAAPVTPPVPAPSGLRINRPPVAPPAHAESTVHAPTAPPVPAYTRPYQPPKPLPPQANFPLGVVGGIVAGGIAMMGWYLLVMVTHYEIGFAATLVGIVTGLGVRILARDGSPGLAYVAAVCAILAILGGEFLAVNHVINTVIGQGTGSAETVYNELMKEAKEGVQLQTDAEIKKWLEANDDSGDPVTPQDIQEFRTVRQPKMQDLLNGKPSKAEFLGKIKVPSLSLGTRYTIFKETIGFYTVLWIIFGVIGAARVAYK